MTLQETKERLAAWLVAGVASVALLAAAAAFALAADRHAPVLFLNLTELPPAPAAIAAIAESAPQIIEQAPATPDEPETDEHAPKHPEPDLAPQVPETASLSLTKVDLPVTADLAVPRPVEEPEPKADPEPKPEKKQTADKSKKVERKTEAERPEDTASASTNVPRVTGKTKSGGAISPAAYAKAVMKKVRSTKKKSGPGKGTVVVGFTIGSDGGLVGLQVLQSSGNPALDKIALDHIRRSAPFPVPPEDAGRSYSFEFVGK